MALDIFNNVVDIGTLVPGLDAAIAGEDIPGADGDEKQGDAVDTAIDDILDASETGDDESDDGDKNNSDDATQESDNVDNEVKAPEAPGALDQAILRLQALEQENSSLRSDLETAKVKYEAPVFVPYEKLPLDVQQLFDEHAASYGIDPRQLVYDHFKDLQREHESKARQYFSTQGQGAVGAYKAVDDFFKAHPLKAKFGDIVPKMVAEMGWQRLAPLAQRDPELFKNTALTLVDAAFRKAEGDDAIKQRTLKQQKTLKESTRSEASRSKSSSPIPKPATKQGDIDAKSMVEFVKGNANPLASLFK